MTNKKTLGRYIILVLTNLILTGMNPLLAKPKALIIFDRFEYTPIIDSVLEDYDVTLVTTSRYYGLRHPVKKAEGDFQFEGLPSYDAILTFASTIHNLEYIATLTRSDDLNYDVSRVRKELNLRGPSDDQLIYFQSKAQMAEAAVKTGINAPLTFKVTEEGTILPMSLDAEVSKQEVLEAAQNRIDWVVKPDEDCGGNGVKFFKRINDAVDYAINESIKLKRSFLIQKKVEGNIIRYDGIIEGGNVTNSVASINWPNPRLFCQGDVCHFWEVTLSEKNEQDAILIAKMKDQIGKIATYSGIDKTVFHGEFILDGEEPVFLEVGARVGGAFVAAVWNECGFNLPVAQLLTQLDRPATESYEIATKFPTVIGGIIPKISNLQDSLRSTYFDSLNTPHISPIPGTHLRSWTPSRHSRMSSKSDNSSIIAMFANKETYKHSSAQSRLATIQSDYPEITVNCVTKSTSPEIIDLCSDTKSRPSQNIMHSLATSSVGDNAFKEDSDTNEAESRVAEVFGHEKAQFMPTGTMSNQVALRAIGASFPSGSVAVADSRAHIVWYESAGARACSSVRVETVDLESFGRPIDIISKRLSDRSFGAMYDSVSAIWLELPIGSRANQRMSIEELTELTESIKGINPNIHIHIDFSRVWEVAIDSGNRFSWYEELMAYGSLADSLTVCLNKQLSAPVGAFLVGSNEFIAKARKEAKAFGGIMHQTGPLAAGVLAAMNEDFISQIRTNNMRCSQFFPVLKSKAELLGLELEFLFSESSMIFVKGDEESIEALKSYLEYRGIIGFKLNKNILRYTFSNLVGELEFESLMHRLEND